MPARHKPANGGYNTTNPDYYVRNNPIHSIGETPIPTPAPDRIGHHPCSWLEFSIVIGVIVALYIATFGDIF